MFSYKILFLYKSFNILLKGLYKYTIQKDLMPVKV